MNKKIVLEANSQLEQNNNKRDVFISFYIFLFRNREVSPLANFDEKKRKRKAKP